MPFPQRMTKKMRDWLSDRDNMDLGMIKEALSEDQYAKVNEAVDELSKKLMDDVTVYVHIVSDDDRNGVPVTAYVSVYYADGDSYGGYTQVVPYIKEVQLLTKAERRDLGRHREVLQEQIDRHKAKIATLEAELKGAT